MGRKDDTRRKEIIQRDSWLCTAILERIEHARAKHPDWAGMGATAAFAIILGEVAELKEAISGESEERQKDEALDVIATCCRFILGEHK